MTGDQIKADLERGAKAFEFMHKLFSGTVTRADVVNVLEEIQVDIPLAHDFFASETCVAAIQKIRDLEQRRLLLNEAARLLNRWFDGTLSEWEYAE